MEEQIKALIEKYEKMSKEHRSIAEKSKLHGNDFGYAEFMGRHFENNEIATDLKKLLEPPF